LLSSVDHEAEEPLPVTCHDEQRDPLVFWKENINA
jgi:hypothetical protein